MLNILCFSSNILIIDYYLILKDTSIVGYARSKLNVAKIREKCINTVKAKEGEEDTLETFWSINHYVAACQKAGDSQFSAARRASRPSQPVAWFAPSPQRHVVAWHRASPAWPALLDSPSRPSSTARAKYARCKPVSTGTAAVSGAPAASPSFGASSCDA